MKQDEPVVSHWHQLYENFHASADEFYQLVEEGIVRRELPDTSISRVERKEGGVLSANREYLRITQGPLTMDVCAAPYGTGFFFSSWLVAPVPSGMLYFFALLFSLFCIVVTSFSLAMYFQGPLVGAIGGLVTSIIVSVAACAFAALGVHSRIIGDEESVMAMPLFGRLYQKIFAPITYFYSDTQLMFRESIQAAVLEAVDAVTDVAGNRQLHLVDPPSPLSPPAIS